MPAERLEIIFDTACHYPGRVSFDISFRNMRYVDHRDAGTPEASKIAHDLRVTAKRAGFRYVRGQDDERRFDRLCHHRRCVREQSLALVEWSMI
ncbi:hypothetical protein [Sinorhizobium fredii]